MYGVYPVIEDSDGNVDYWSLGLRMMIVIDVEVVLEFWHHWPARSRVLSGGLIWTANSGLPILFRTFCFGALFFGGCDKSTKTHPAKDNYF